MADSYRITDFKSGIMNGQYVFYERLNTDGVEGGAELYKNAKSAMVRANSIVNNNNSSSTMITQMATTELNKEVALLEKIFKVKVDKTDLRSGDFYKKFVAALNNAISIKEVYERNLDLIKQTDARNEKTVFSFFGEYFEKAFKENNSANYSMAYALTQIRNQIQANPERKIPDIAEEVLSEVLPRTSERAAVLMFSARGEHAFSEEDKIKYQTAYQEVLKVIEDKTSDRGNKFLQEMYKEYDIDNVKNAFVNELKNSSTEAQKSLIKKSSRSIFGKISNTSAQQGYTLEYLSELVSGIVIDELQGNPNFEVTGESIQVGGKQAKADNIITFNIPTGSIVETINTTATRDRNDNIKLFEKIGANLTDMSGDGFVIYSSAKNYNIGKQGTNRFKGFSAGSTMTMRNFSSAFANISSNMIDFVGSILQLGEGAVGAGVANKSEYELALAQYIAYFLFDDFTEIGKELVNHQTNTLHLMDLNGVYLPLSYILTLLANAMQKSTNTRKVSNVNITVPPIIYSSIQEESADRAKGVSPWAKQKNSALDNTKIKLEFLEGLQQFLKAF